MSLNTTDNHLLHVVVPGSLATLTGGYHYDRRIVEALRAQGHGVKVHELVGDYPNPNDIARRDAQSLFNSVPDEAIVIVDGLALGALPELAVQAATRASLIALVHHPLADESGLAERDRQRLFDSERRALSSARGIVTTSESTARRLVDRYDVDPARISTVMPGTEAAALATGSDDSIDRLLCVATVTPRKGHIDLVNALAMIAHRQWQLDCVGSTLRDAACTRDVQNAITRHGLTQQITLHGELEGEALASRYANADLFVLATHYEGYGMVFDEAIARGLPIIASGAGAVTATVPSSAGLLVEARDVDALGDALHRWFDDNGLRRRLREGAQAARGSLRSWSACGHEFALALNRFVS